MLGLPAANCLATENDPFNSTRVSGNKNNGNQSDPFNSGRKGNFNDYRVSLNAEYARQIKEYEWKQLQKNKGELPPDRDIKPVSPVAWDDKGKKDREDKEVKIDEVVKPIKGGNAKPIAPVQVPEDGAKQPGFQVQFLGTPVTLHGPQTKLSLKSTSQDAIADMWMRLSQPEYATLVANCLEQKQKLAMCDWAFLLFADAVAKECTSDANSRAVMQTYLVSQAGYNVRIASTAENRLDMMYASQHKIFDRPYISSEGFNYFPFATDSKSYRLCTSRFKNETGLSLWINKLPKVTTNPSGNRSIASKRYPDFKLTSNVNKNLISFYDTYPTSSLGSNPVSRWAMYANTPISDHVRQQFYPQLRNLTAGKSSLEAVERILNWIQTGFVYEYDDKVWGGDRAFFAEESLYYPYCDCEDRSILLTRLVRDILGLKCLLVFYPGHLAAAINFPTDVQGDYIMYGGKRFTITDPTYIGAPVGRTMPDMDNSSAKVILLE